MTAQLELGEALRDEGVARADQAADDAWKAEVDRVIRRLAARGAPFTSDDVRAAGVPEPASHKAWGGRYTALAKAGVIRAVGWQTSSNPATHARPVRVWVGVGS